jgi:hypothetical protein
MAPIIDFSQTDPPTHSFRLSVLSVGCGALLFVFLLPFTRASDIGPGFGRDCVAWLIGSTLVFGVAALIRRERGHLALASAMMTVAVTGLILLGVIVGGGSALLMRVFMSN